MRKGFIAFEAVIAVIVLSTILWTLSVIFPIFQQYWARHHGGSYTITLPVGKKMIPPPSWKGSSLWICTRNATVTDTPETYTYAEDSAYGVLEGQVIIKEQVKQATGSGTYLSPRN